MRASRYEPSSQLSIRTGRQTQLRACQTASQSAHGAPRRSVPGTRVPVHSTREAYPKTCPAATRKRPCKCGQHANTIVPNPADPQTFNRYSYALGNPLKFVDPTGHSVDCAYGEQYCHAGRLDTGRRAQDLANSHANDGTPYSELSDREQSILAEGGLGPAGYNEVVSGGVSPADPLHDPATYVAAAAGGVYGLTKVGPTLAFQAGTQCLANAICAALIGAGAHGATQSATSQSTYLEYRALRAQGYTAAQAYKLIQQFRSGANPGQQFAFHFTSTQGAQGIVASGEIWATARGLAGPGVYMGTTSTPGVMRVIPILGYGLAPWANVRIPVYLSPDVQAALTYPLLPLQTVIYGTGQALHLVP